MGGFLMLFLLLGLNAPRRPTVTAKGGSITSDGWTVSADGAHGIFTVVHEKLGTVLRNARLNLREGRVLLTFNNWSAEGIEQNQLSIKTTKPPTAWLVTLRPNALEISSSSAEGVVTALAPAPVERTVARLVDPEGAPVTWVGTDEVASSYGGSETRDPSHLPRRNPDVIYFALGQVSSTNLHSLFDRKLDIAVQFSEQTLMERDAQDPDVLEVTIPVLGHAQVSVLPDYYTKMLGVPYFVPFDDSYFSRPPMVWSSWTSYYDQVKEEDIVRNADWIAAHLKAYGFQYVQLDDGYDRGKKGEHYWIEQWDGEKFPHGPKWLADYIKSKGLHPGIWIVPNSYAGAVNQHPEWYLRFKDGRMVKDYDTPALDSTNPEVLQFLHREFTILDDWGFEYYKFDGEHAIAKYAPGVDLDRLYDNRIDPLLAYRNRLKLIRETIGPKRFIEGCPAGTPLNGIGYFQSYFNGHDVYTSWQGMYPLFSSISANAFLNHVLLYVMPGEGMELSTPMSVAEAEKRRDMRVVETARTRESPVAGFGTSLAEARTVISYVALAGVAYSLASVMPELPAERVQLLKMTLPTVPILPIDLFSRGTDMQWDKFKHTTPDEYIHNYPETLDLKVNEKAGVYDVVALTNWRSWPTTQTLPFAEKLGLDDATPYVAFDFWNQKLLGVFKNRMDVRIEPHDTRVLFIRPLSNHPQLVGISRHISGTYSIKDLAWDSVTNTLRGSCETVAGEPYTLWIYVPVRLSASEVRVTTKGNRQLQVERESLGNSLKVTFQGSPESVDWLVRFAAKAQ